MRRKENWILVGLALIVVIMGILTAIIGCGRCEDASPGDAVANRDGESDSGNDSSVAAETLCEDESMSIDQFAELLNRFLDKGESFALLIGREPDQVMRQDYYDDIEQIPCLSSSKYINFFGGEKDPSYLSEVLEAIPEDDYDHLLITLDVCSGTVTGGSMDELKGLMSNVASRENFGDVILFHYGECSLDDERPLVQILGEKYHVPVYFYSVVCRKNSNQKTN